MVPHQLRELLLHRRHHRRHHRRQVCLAAAIGNSSIPHVRSPSPAARKRNALRLASGSRYGPGLFHRAPPLRRQTVERKARHRDCRLVECHHPRCRRLPARRLQSGPRVRGTAPPARHSRGDRLDHVRRQYLRHHRHPQVRADVRFALVHHGHHPVDRIRVPHRQLRRTRRYRRQPGQSQLDVRAQRRRPDLHARSVWPSRTISFQKRRTLHSTATSFR